MKNDKWEVHEQPHDCRSGDGLDFSIMSADEAGNVSVLMLIAPAGPVTPEFKTNLHSMALAVNSHTMLIAALEFYADPKRHEGANQRNDADDKFSNGSAYLFDVTRDGGGIARAALKLAQDGK
jgi:hypothetical protein